MSAGLLRRAWTLARLPLGRLRVRACGLCAALVADEHADAHDRYHRATHNGAEPSPERHD